MRITDRFLQGLKATDRRQEFRDEAAMGLFVTVQPKGSRGNSPTVTFQSRLRRDGKEHKISLGKYPLLSLADAREAAWKIAAGRETGERTVIIGKSDAPLITFRAAWGLYMKHEGSAKKTAKAKQSIFEREMVAFHDRPVVSIAKAEIKRLISERHAIYPQAARALLMVIKRFLAWCEECDHLTGVDVNRAASIKPLVQITARDRYLDDQEIRWFFAALPACGARYRSATVSDEFPTIIELIARTVLRRSSIFNLTWGEVIEGADGQPEQLSFKANRMKNGEPFLVWLHPSAARLLAVRTRGKDGDRVFRAEPSEDKICALRKEMARLAALEGKSLERWCLHDWRRTATTILAGKLDSEDRQMVPPHVRDALLGHVDSSVRGKHYDKYNCYAEKKTALKIWNEHLDHIRVPALRLVA